MGKGGPAVGSDCCAVLSTTTYFENLFLIFPYRPLFFHNSNSMTMMGMNTQILAFALATAAVVCSLYNERGFWSLISGFRFIRKNNQITTSRATIGHWVYNHNKLRPRYNFSQQMCESSYMDIGDCKKNQFCQGDLMNWIYLESKLILFDDYTII